MPEFLQPHMTWLAWLGAGLLAAVAALAVLWACLLAAVAAIQFRPKLHTGRPKNVIELTAHYPGRPDALVHDRLRISWWLAAGWRHSWLFGFIRLCRSERQTATTD